MVPSLRRADACARSRPSGSALLGPGQRCAVTHDPGVVARRVRKHTRNGHAPTRRGPRVDRCRRSSLVPRVSVRSDAGASAARGRGGAGSRCRADVAIEHSSEMSLVHDEETVGALRRTVLTQHSATAFALGARTGHRTTLAPSPFHTASKAGPDFPSRSRSRYLAAMPASRRSAVALRAHWVTHSQVGFVVVPAQNTRRVPWWVKKRT